ncbi:MAG: glutamine-hydrolyzing carbamoyl-phosphate synthase small subunit [Clostridiaceae bacterium]|nr:glutamine-hydrolyzing carbamoyl-phosphate synthase small subunit [Clostridiaceae bacterium]
MKAILMLEDGTVFVGTSKGACGNTVGEVVFNTAMTGYQKILTDPSNYGQIVAMTCPLIGNYGVNSEDSESGKIHVKGFIAREICDFPNYWRSNGTLGEYLKSNNIVCITGIDTRALTVHLRDNGTMNGIITTGENPGYDNLLKKAREYRILKPVSKVTTCDVKHFKDSGKRIAILDLGVKRSLINAFRKRKCELFLFPSFTPPEEILAVNPDGVVISDGPGDPKDCGKVIETIKGLAGKKPIFGVSLGHQVAALALGADTAKLKYGHRGNNHPVRDIKRGISFTTSQNHGFTVVLESLSESRVEVTHTSMNDETVEGLRYSDVPVITCQFDPETLPRTAGMVDLIGDFLKLL